MICFNVRAVDLLLSAVLFLWNTKEEKKKTSTKKLPPKRETSYCPVSINKSVFVYNLKCFNWNSIFNLVHLWRWTRDTKNAFVFVSCIIIQQVLFFTKRLGLSFRFSRNRKHFKRKQATGRLAPPTALFTFHSICLIFSILKSEIFLKKSFFNMLFC